MAAGSYFEDHEIDDVKLKADVFCVTRFLARVLLVSNVVSQFF